MELETDRLLLRRWRDADRAPYAALNSDPEVMRYFPGTLSREASDAMVDRIEAALEDNGFGLWALEVKATGEFIGFTGLAWQRYDAPFTPAVEVGWRLAQAAWGRGYASEAAQASLRAGFEDFDLAEIVSVTSVSNERSQAVMRRIGMHRDPADDFEYPNLPEGHPLRPHVLYRLTREEWLTNPPS